jgi:hypothetical protein
MARSCEVARRQELLNEEKAPTSGAFVWWKKADHGLAAGINDAFRQGGIAVGVAAFGALVPASAALGHGSPGSYVSGLHHALLVGAALAGVGGIATSRLIPARRNASQTQPIAATDSLSELG